MKYVAVSADYAMPGKSMHQNLPKNVAPEVKAKVRITSARPLIDVYEAFRGMKRNEPKSY
jgi:hypothetical protein